jgi:hypothetical protein
MPDWDELATAVPDMVASMRRYLTQIACSLRPGSVRGADLALRAFTSFLTEHHPEITTVAAVSRRHIEDYKPWLAARPGQKTPRLTTNTIAHRPGIMWNLICQVHWCFPWLTVTIGSRVAVAGTPICRGVAPAGVGTSTSRSSS